MLGFALTRVEDGDTDAAPVTLVAQSIDDIVRTGRAAGVAPTTTQQQTSTATVFRTLPPHVRAILLQRWPFGPRTAASPWSYHVGVAAAWAPLTHIDNRDLLSKLCVTRH